MMPLRPALRLFALSLVLGGAVHAERSPFEPAAGAGPATAATPDAPLELRGIIADGEDFRFSIYNSAKKTSDWVRRNETGREFIVKAHDAARDMVTVEQNGRTFTLALKAGKVAAAPAIAARPPGAPPQPIGGPVVLNPTPADEQRRLEAVAAEVRRRRALREQAAQSANQAQK